MTGSSLLGSAGRVVVRELTTVPRRDGIVDLDALLALLGPCDLLESADRSGWSSLAPHDLSPGLLVDDGRRTRLHHADGDVEDLGDDPAVALDVVAERLGLDPCATAEPDLSIPFRGGLLGAFAYELGDRLLPRVPRREREPDQHDLMLRIVGTLVAVPRTRDRALVVVDEGIQRRSAAAVLAMLEDRCRGAADTVERDTSLTGRVGSGAVRTSLPHALHVAAVEDALARIGRGETYQVNIAQQLATEVDIDLMTLYRRLRAASPASHAALLPGAGLASISPERFLDVTAGTVTTDPIKGTRRRADDPELDAALADDLATSMKDRAENVMVVDLERNDLGRVCIPGSVHVPSLLELRALPTVWHLVSRVRGTLRPGTTYGELLRATFPSGSVTGAPRLAAMQAIRALEPVPRGWYCGAVGFLGRGSAALSVAIRTATLRAGTVVYGAGGGIVADSDPQDEVAETLDKAAAFLTAVDATHVTSAVGDGAAATAR